MILPTIQDIIVLIQVLPRRFIIKQVQSILMIQQQQVITTIARLREIKGYQQLQKPLIIWGDYLIQLRKRFKSRNTQTISLKRKWKWNLVIFHPACQAIINLHLLKLKLPIPTLVLVAVKEFLRQDNLIHLQQSQVL